MKKLTSTLAIHYNDHLVGFENGFAHLAVPQEGSFVKVEFTDNFQFGFDTTNVDLKQLDAVMNFLKKSHYYQVSGIFTHYPPIEDFGGNLRILSIHLRYSSNPVSGQTLEDVVGHLLPETEIQRYLRELCESLWDSTPVKLVRSFALWLSKGIVWVKKKSFRFWKS